MLETIAKGVNQRISKARKTLKLSAEEFGEQIGVSRVYIHMLERGARNPSQALLIAIAAKMGIGEKWLRTGTGRFRASR